MENTELQTYTEDAYRKAFKAYGVPKEMRSPDHFFFDDSAPGQLYAIPRQIEIVDNQSEPSELHQNGAVVALDAKIEVDTQVGSRAMIRSGAKVTGLFVEIQSGAIIGKGSQIENNSVIRSSAKHPTVIGAEAIIGVGADIDKGVTFGDKTSLGNRSKVGYGTSIGSWTTIYADSHIGNDNKIGDGVIFGPNATTFQNVTLKDRVGVIQGTSVGAGSMFMEGTVNQKLNIREGTVIVPPKFKHTLYGAAPKQSGRL